MCSGSWEPERDRAHSACVWMMRRRRLFIRWEHAVATDGNLDRRTSVGCTHGDKDEGPSWLCQGSGPTVKVVVFCLLGKYEMWVFGSWRTRDAAARELTQHLVCHRKCTIGCAA